MNTNPDNLGWLERPIVVFWANLLAALYCLRCPLGYRVAIETRWVEDRAHRDKYGDPFYREEVTFIGVTVTNEAMRQEIVKVFFGKSRFLE